MKIIFNTINKNKDIMHSYNKIVMIMRILYLLMIMKNTKILGSVKLVQGKQTQLQKIHLTFDI